MKNYLKGKSPLLLVAVLGLIIAAAALIDPRIAILLPALAVGSVTIDMKGEFGFLTISDIAARTSTVTGSAIDLQTYIGKVAIIQQVGTVSGTTPTLDGKIQDSADGSTGWTDVSGATFTQVTASNNQQVIAVDTRVARRYVRYVGTIAGTTPSFAVGVIATGEKQYS